MPIRLVILWSVCLVILSAKLWAHTPQQNGDVRQFFLTCQQQPDETLRLQCYDKTVEQHFSYDFSGVGARRTEVFNRSQAFQVKYQNNDVIFVIYVFRANGDLVKSYGTGPGTGILKIAEQGEFYIEVKATGAWRLWLQDAKPTQQAATEKVIKMPATRIKDYQIRRLIIYRSECDPKQIRQLASRTALPDDLARKDREDANQSSNRVFFYAACNNETFYPDGIYIRCTDANNEQSCLLFNSSRQFENLRLLQ